MKIDNRPMMFYPFKSLFLAIFLAVILGPIGVVYSTFVGSIIMLIVTFIFVIIAPFTSYALVYLCWIICVYWTVFATNAYNKNIAEQFKMDVIED